MHAALRTPLCSLLGIELPILQSGMRRVAGPELVAAVSRAGGLGVLAGLVTPARELRAQIAQVRALTDRPFGVNLWLHEAVQSPITPASIAPANLRAAQRELDVFRSRLATPLRGQTSAPTPPSQLVDLLDEAFEVLLEERVAVFSVGLGDPGSERVARCHAAGVRVIAMATNLTDARVLEAHGVDAVVAQASEAGGHRSTWVKTDAQAAAGVGGFALFAELADALHVPVIAAGGIADGRGLVAALALGAQAVLLGTRFVATHESLSPEFFKDAIVTSDASATSITEVYTGLHARGIRNRFMDEYEQSGAPVLPPMLQTSAAEDIYGAASKAGNRDYFPMLAGQSVGLVHERKSAADVVAALVAEAEQVLTRLGR